MVRRLLVCLVVLVVWSMFPCQICAATVYWDRCSAFCCDDVPMHGDFEPAHRPNVCILSVLVTGSNGGLLALGIGIVLLRRHRK